MMEMTALPIAPPRNWLADQRAAIREKVAELRRQDARAHIRRVVMLKRIGARAEQLDTLGERSRWKRLLRRVAA